MTNHADYKFSVSIKSNDLAVVNCLRAPSQYSQQSGNNRIPWGGTKDEDWKRDGQTVTFLFTTPEYRASFVREAKRSLPIALWEVADQSNNNPASPQS